MALEASEIAVRIRLLGGSAFEAEAARAAKSTEAIGAAGKKANASLVAGSTKAHSALEKTSSKLKKVGTQVTDVGRSLTTMGVPLAAVGYIAGKSSAQFNQAMTLLSTQALVPARQIAGLSKTVKSLAPTFGTTALDMAKALYPIYSSGAKGTLALQELRAAGLGSAVGLDTLANTADAVSSIMASHIKGSGGPIEAMSLMDRAIGLGKMHLVDLVDSFKSGVVPMAATFHMSFRQILAMEAALTRMGMPASSVMARARLMMTSMKSPGAQATKALASLGLGKYQLGSDLNTPGGLFTALEDLKMGASGQPGGAEGNRAIDLIAQIFGKSRGMAQIASLLHVLDTGNQIYSSMLGTTPATLMQHFRQTEQTPAFKYKKLQSQAYNALIGLGDVVNKYVLPLLIKMVPYVTQMVAWFGKLPPGLQKFTMILLGLTIVGGPILMFAGALIKVAGFALPFLEGAITSFGASLGADMALLAPAFAALLPAIAAVTAAMIVFAARHKIMHAGNQFSRHVIRPGLDPLLNQFGIGNVKGRKQEDYLLGIGGSNFGRLSISQRSAILSLMRDPSEHRDPFGNVMVGSGGRALPLSYYQKALSGVTLPSFLNVPGLTSGITHEVNGMHGDWRASITVPVYLDSKVLAQAVASVNRKNQNRR